MFDIEGKVAIVTGGASGIGLHIVKELLRNGLKGITLVDVSENNGLKVLADVEKEFGKGKAIFARANIFQKDEFEAAFIKTLENFQHIDILINNAGIYNDLQWENEVDINIKGTINGIILGMEKYLKNYKQGSEAIILNTSSIAAFRPGPWMPVYGCTKAAVVGMTQTWGHDFHYERTKVRVVALCPGSTHTPLLSLVDDEKNVLFVNPEYRLARVSTSDEDGLAYRQSPDFVAQQTVRILKFAPNGSLWIVEAGGPAYQYKVQERKYYKDNILRETN